MKRKTHLFFFDLSVLSIVIAEDPYLPDGNGKWQGGPVPDGLLKGYSEVRVRGRRVCKIGLVSRVGRSRQRLHPYLSKGKQIHPDCDPCRHGVIPWPS